MRKFIDFMMTHPLAAGIAGLFLGLISILFFTTAVEALSEGMFRLSLVGDMP